MISLLLFVACAFTAWVIWRTGVFSPAAIVCAFTTASEIVFCWLVYSGVEVPKRGNGLSWALNDYGSQAMQVMTIYTLAVVVAGLATLGLGRKTGGASEAVSEFILALLNRFLVSSAIPLVTVGLFLLTVIHLMLSLSGYAEFPLTKIIGQGSGPICIMIACLAIYSWRKQNPLILAVLAVTFAYHYLLLLATFSRYTSLVWVVAAILLISQRMTARRPPMSVGIVACLAFSAWLFLFALEGRIYRNHDTDPSHVDVGLISSTLFSVQADGTTLDMVTLNVFQGPLVLAEALRLAPLTYQSQYETLSFSPLPAFADNWRNVINLQFRVNQNTPFSAFAELYYFSPVYLLAFLVIFVASIRILTRAYLQLGAVAGLLLMSPCIYALLYLHQYPLRNSLRLIYYTTFVVYLLSQNLYRRAIAATQAGEPAAIPEPAVGQAPLMPQAALAARLRAARR